MRDYHSNFIPSCLSAYFVCTFEGTFVSFVDVHCHGGTERLFQDFSSRSFPRRSYESNIHPNRFRIRPRQSDFDSSSRWIFSLKSCRSPRNRRYFPRFYSCPPSRVGFGDRRPCFERVHQVPTFLISQFFRLSQSFSTRVSCFQGREQQPGLTTAGTPFGQANLGDESLNIVRCVVV
jgi:hypothetical protein